MGLFDITNTEGTASGLTADESGTGISYSNDGTGKRTTNVTEKSTDKLVDPSSYSMGSFGFLPEDQEYVRKLTKMMSEPVAKDLQTADYYPSKDTSLVESAITTTGFGTTPLFAAGALIPQGVIDARKLAAKEYQEQLELEAKTAEDKIKFYQISDKLKNNIFLENQAADWQTYFDTEMPKYKKLYGSPLQARIALLNSASTKQKMMRWSNLSEGFNETYAKGVEVMTDPEAAYDYDSDTLNLYKKFMDKTFSFKSDNIDELSEFYNKINKRENLRDYSKKIGALVGDNLLTAETMKNFLYDIETGKATKTASGDYDIITTLNRTNKTLYDKAIADAITEYERIGGKVTAGDKEALQFYLENDLRQKATIALSTPSKYNAGARVWEHAQTKKIDKEQEPIKPQKDVIDPVTNSQVTQWSLKDKGLKVSLDTKTRGDIIVTYKDGTTKIIPQQNIPAEYDYTILTYQEGVKDGVIGRNAYIASDKINALANAAGYTDPNIITVKAKIPYKNVQSKVVSSGIPMEGAYEERETNVPLSKEKLAKGAESSGSEYIETKTLNGKSYGKKADGTWVEL